MDFFPPKEENALKCALQLGRSSLTTLCIVGCGSFALSKYKSALTACTHLQSVTVIGFTLSQRQVTMLLSCSSINKLEIQIREEEHDQILASSLLLSVVLHNMHALSVANIFQAWSRLGYSPADMKLCIHHHNAGLRQTLMSLNLNYQHVPQCLHKARFSIAFDSIHPY